MTTPAHDTAEGYVADTATILLGMLFLFPDEEYIPVQRTIIAGLLRNLQAALTLLRH